MLRTQPVFLHTKNIVLIFLKKGQHIPDTAGGHKGPVCLSLSQVRRMPWLSFWRPHRCRRVTESPGTWKQWLPLGFGLCSFPSVLSTYALSHVNRSLNLSKEASQGPALGPQSPWKRVPLLPLLSLPLFRARGSLACCSEAILSLLIFRLFSLSLLSAVKLDFERYSRSRFSLVYNPQIPWTTLSIPVRTSWRCSFFSWFLWLSRDNGPLSFPRSLSFHLPAFSYPIVQLFGSETGMLSSSVCKVKEHGSFQENTKAECLSDGAAAESE